MYLFSKGLSSAFGEKVHQTDNILILATKKILGAVKLFFVPPQNVLKNVHKPKVGNASHMNASYNHITHDEHWCFWYSINAFIHTA